MRIREFLHRYIVRPIGHTLYWFRANTYNRYHMLDMSNPFWKWGWRDVDHQMLSACFNLLKQYVEGEHPFEYIDWEASGKLAVETEIKELYLWWTKERWENMELANQAYNSYPLGKEEWYEACEELDRQDNTMLQRLINIREYLWT